MTINFYLNIGNRKSKDNKPLNKEMAIFCYIRENYNTLAINTGLKVLPKYFNNKKHRVSSSYPNYAEINNLLELFKNRILNIKLKYEIENINPTWDGLKKVIKDKFSKTSDYTTADIINKYLEFKESKVKEITVRDIKQILSYLHPIASEDIRNFDSIDYIQKSFNLLSDGVSNSTKKVRLQNYKSFLIWCFENSYIKTDNYKKFQPEIKIVKTETYTVLNLNDIHKFYNADTTIELENYKKLFLLQITTGQRIEDIINFDISQVKNNIWSFNQSKTNKFVEVPLLDCILSYIFEFNVKFKKHNNTTLNTKLKQICKVANIDNYDKITTHTLRHSFVSLLAESNIDNNTIDFLTGHKNNSMQFRYFSVTDFQQLKNKLENIFKL